ncbi:hypothetical protein SRABI96_03582 [Peribacillus sp. Bi96]|uniref:hypothetical protein n=1 Tax=Peribacillus sp. Bi96 TaxID=2884273 RepID=UPI001DBCC7CF|nr:hypothetical protein [Peribacillus sp. Bi96]CAH0266898.1 hypothetical protein SRABI96_03582 [Peribacillus sp. Bi96]
MLEIICAILSFVGAQIIFSRTSLGEKLTPWKSVGLSILIIGFSIFLFSAMGSTYYLIVIVPTIICSVMVSSRYRDYLMGLQAKRAQWKESRKGVNDSL